MIDSSPSIVLSPAELTRKLKSILDMLAVPGSGPVIVGRRGSAEAVLVPISQYMQLLELDEDREMKGQGRGLSPTGKRAANFV